MQESTGTGTESKNWVLVYINPIITSVALFCQTIACLPEKPVYIFELLFFLSSYWFIVAWLGALSQFVYGLIQYIRTKDRRYLHHIYSACLVGLEHICLIAVISLGYSCYLMA